MAQDSFKDTFHLTDESELSTFWARSRISARRENGPRRNLSIFFGLIVQEIRECDRVISSPRLVSCKEEKISAPRKRAEPEILP